MEAFQAGLYITERCTPAANVNATNTHHRARVGQDFLRQSESHQSSRLWSHWPRASGTVHQPMEIVVLVAVPGGHLSQSDHCYCWLSIRPETPRSECWDCQDHSMQRWHAGIKYVYIRSAAAAGPVLTSEFILLPRALLVSLPSTWMNMTGTLGLGKGKPGGLGRAAADTPLLNSLSKTQTHSVG